MDAQAFELLMNKLKSQDESLSIIEQKIDGLNHWRWKNEGIRIVIVFVISVCVSYFIK